MSCPSAEQIADIVLHRQEVYGLDVDTRIREVANRLTARALFELLARMDDQSPEFAAQFSALLRDLPAGSHSHLIAFRSHEGARKGGRAEASEPLAEPSEHYLRLVFRDEQAAYYQFNLFPDLDADFILGSSRERAGDAQYLRLTLSRPEALQTFIESCRKNPHFSRVEQITAEEFHRAPSHSV